MKNLDMNSTEILDFVGTYHTKLQLIKKDIRDNLIIEPSPNKGKLQFIHFSDLEDSWWPFSSTTLKILADKLCHMIDTGNSPSIKPMLVSICNNNIKKQSKPNTVGNAEFLGYGHFRWNEKAQTLNKKEIEIIKQYFNL